ncbi:MAG: hypothetical protein DMF92_23380 [Acidobacteria bacterium]|nr:MAG: hypothetical protein DMF92_23380 [Acidobacteriota bacterium]
MADDESANAPDGDDCGAHREPAGSDHQTAIKVHVAQPANRGEVDEIRESERLRVAQGWNDTSLKYDMSFPKPGVYARGRGRAKTVPGERQP